MDVAPRFINELLSGPKYLEFGEFTRVCLAFNAKPEAVHINFRVDNEGMVCRYSVSLVHNLALVLRELAGIRTPGRTAWCAGGRACVRQWNCCRVD